MAREGRKGAPNPMNLGRITSDDVALFLALSDSLLRETDEARAILLDKSGDLFSPACAKPCWCHLYELPLLQHAMQGISFLGDSDVVQRLASSENQIREAQSLIDQVSADIDAWEPSSEEKAELRRSLAAIYSLGFSLTNTFRSLMVYGVYLNDLIAVVRKGGEDAGKALLSAVKIDPTVVGCPSAIVYISQKTLLEDKKFLGKLGRAISGGLTASEQWRLDKVRLVLQVLHETKAKHLSGPDLYQLFVDELEIVEGDELSNSDVGNVENNLRQFAYQFFKKKAVSQTA